MDLIYFSGPPTSTRLRNRTGGLHTSAVRKPLIDIYATEKHFPATGKNHFWWHLIRMPCVGPLQVLHRCASHLSEFLKGQCAIHFLISDRFCDYGNHEPRLKIERK